MQANKQLQMEKVYPVYWKATVNNHVLSPDLIELTILADFRYSGSFLYRWGAQKLKAASPCLVQHQQKIKKTEKQHRNNVINLICQPALLVLINPNIKLDGFSSKKQLDLILATNLHINPFSNSIELKTYVDSLSALLKSGHFFFTGLPAADLSP